MDYERYPKKDSSVVLYIRAYYQWHPFRVGSKKFANHLLETKAITAGDLRYATVNQEFHIDSVIDDREVYLYDRGEFQRDTFIVTKVDHQRGIIEGEKHDESDERIDYYTIFLP